MFFKNLLRTQYHQLRMVNKKMPRPQRVAPYMVGSFFYIHNGRRLKKLSIVRSHVGFKLGEFFFTRRIIKHKKKKK